ncbi:unnamed protein product [Adineta steineri]|uniref:Uncharacterized protein n=1 Tax=Adineta steineri TaxID=433720 RepID=A0A818XXQ8_9BILA|nr:unnamed protein product [Adineta steineri]
MSSSILFKRILVTLFVCLSIQVINCKGYHRRHRREIVYNNYGAYSSQSDVDISNGINHNNNYGGNGLIFNERVYQYPTPVNVMNGGSYDSQRYDTYPDRNRDYYPNLNDMRLPSNNLQNSNYYQQSHFNRFLFNTGYGWLLFMKERQTIFHDGAHA